MSTYADFEWTTGWSEYDSYCLAFIRDATVTEVIDALPVFADLGERGGNALAAMSWDSWERIGSKRLLVGLLQLGFWTIAYEVNGYVGTTNTLMEPVSQGREIVAHHHSAAGTGRFARYIDGHTRTTFEPLFASSRQGAAPRQAITAHAPGRRIPAHTGRRGGPGLSSRPRHIRVDARANKNPPAAISTHPQRLPRNRSTCRPIAATGAG